MSSLEARLRTAALAFPGFAPYLGAGGSFRWYNTQLAQGSSFPAITAQLVSGSKTYVFNGRLSTGFSRMQFTIWDIDAVRVIDVENQLAAFLDQFNGTGINGLAQYPNSIVMQRQMMFPTPEPPRFQRINDAMIFSNDTL